MADVIKNGRKFSAEFNKATVVNGETRILSQTPGQPVEYVDVNQIGEVVTAELQEDVAALELRSGFLKLDTTAFVFSSGTPTAASIWAALGCTTDEEKSAFIERITDAPEVIAVYESDGNYYEGTATRDSSNSVMVIMWNNASMVKRMRFVMLSSDFSIFAQSYSEVAITTKIGAATQEDFDALEAIVATKATQTALDTLSQTVADNKTVAEQSIKNLQDNIEADYAQKDGNYPQLTAGFADNIVGDGSASIDEEISFRPTAGEERNVESTTYDYDQWSNGGARIQTLKGNSVVWNQLVNTDTTEVTLKANYKYFTSIGGVISIQAPTADTVISVDATIDKITDLTKMFTAGNEPTTVEEFYARLPKGVDLNAYNEGEILNGNYGAIKTTGFNQWDEQCRIGGYTDDGVFITYGPELLCNANPIRIIPNATYWRGSGASYTMVCYWYDASMNFLKITYISPNKTITPPSNSAWLNFRMQQEYGSTYNNDICINLNWPEYASLNGTYKPYKPFERVLSWIKEIKDAEGNTLFEDGLKQAGSARDEIRFNSTTQKWEAVKNVEVRAYTSGDESDTTLTTDGTNTNYALATPVIVELADQDINLDYDVADYGTEELIVADGVKSAPLVADIIYQPNALKTLEQVPDILKRLTALETAVANTTTTNETTE